MANVQFTSFCDSWREVWPSLLYRNHPRLLHFVLQTHEGTKWCLLYEWTYKGRQEWLKTITHIFKCGRCWRQGAIEVELPSYYWKADFPILSYVVTEKQGTWKHHSDLYREFSSKILHYGGSFGKGRHLHYHPDNHNPETGMLRQAWQGGQVQGH